MDYIYSTPWPPLPSIPPAHPVLFVTTIAITDQVQIWGWVVPSHPTPNVLRPNFLAHLIFHISPVLLLPRKLDFQGNLKSASNVQVSDWLRERILYHDWGRFSIHDWGRFSVTFEADSLYILRPICTFEADYNLLNNFMWSVCSQCREHTYIGGWFSIHWRDSLYIWGRYLAKMLIDR